MLCCLVASCVNLCCLILSYLVLSCVVLSYVVLCCVCLVLSRVYLVLPWLVLACLCCLVLCFLVLFCLIELGLVLSCLSYLVLPSFVLNFVCCLVCAVLCCFVVCCLLLSNPVLPCLILSCLAFVFSCAVVSSCHVLVLSFSCPCPYFFTLTASLLKVSDLPSLSRCISRSTRDRQSLFAPTTSGTTRLWRSVIASVVPVGLRSGLQFALWAQLNGWVERRMYP